MTITNSADLELSAFALKVEQLAAQRHGREDGLVYSNSGPDKARILVNRLLDSACEKVAIYSGELDEKIYTAETFDALVSRLGAQNIRVLYTSDQANASLIAHLRSIGVIVIKSPEVGAHMVVVDDDCFRIEDDHNLRKALFAFGHSKARDFLSDFDRLWRVLAPTA